jgi:uncharacterized membrane protein YkvA (DUF1232 family)
MPLTVSFELSDKDLKYFRERVREAKNGAARDADASLAAARRLIEQTRRVELPDFVRARIEQLEQLATMLEDADWRLEGADRQRVVSALAYFAEPDDVIPDTIPGIGFLDDAIMVELMCQELRHEIAAYGDFCAYRATLGKQRGEDAALTREEWLARKRLQLQERMRRRRERVWGARLGRPLL